MGGGGLREEVEKKGGMRERARGAHEMKWSNINAVKSQFNHFKPRLQFSLLCLCVCCDTTAQAHGCFEERFYCSQYLCSVSMLVISIFLSRT